VCVWLTYWKGRVYAYRDHCRPGKLIVPYAQEVVDLTRGERIDYCVLSHECFSQHGTGNTQADQFVKVFSQAGIPVIKSDKDAEGRLMLIREYLRTTKIPVGEQDSGIGGDYHYWAKRFKEEGPEAWNDFRKFGADNDGEKLPKLQIMKPGLLPESKDFPRGQSVGCPDLLNALPLLTTDVERPKVIAEGQDDHSFDGLGYSLKSFVINDEASIMEAYQQQLGGRVPDSLLAAHHAMEAAKEIVRDDDPTDLPLKWASESFGDRESEF
jgi:hypothetical protein